MTTYVSAVPLAVVRTIDGGYRNVYRDEEVAGAAVDPDNLERLVRKGFLVEKDETNDGADGSDGPRRSRPTRRPGRPTPAPRAPATRTSTGRPRTT